MVISSAVLFLFFFKSLINTNYIEELIVKREHPLFVYRLINILLNISNILVYILNNKQDISSVLVEYLKTRAE